MSIKPKSYGLIFIILSALLWSFGGICIKVIELSPMSLAAVRCLIPGIIFLPFIKLKRLRFTKALLGALLSYTWTVSTFVISTKITTAANAIMLQYTAPLWLFLGGVLVKGNRPGIRQTMPIISIALGILIFLSEPAKDSSLIGNILAISSGMSFALLSYFLSKPQPQESFGIAALLNLFAGTLLLFFFDFKMGFSQLSTLGWAALAYQGLFQLGLAYVLFHAGLKTVPPLRANIVSLLEPLLNPIWVFLFIREVPSVYAVIGSVFVLGGIIIDTIQLTYRRNRGTLSPTNKSL